MKAVLKPLVFGVPTTLWLLVASIMVRDGHPVPGLIAGFLAIVFFVVMTMSPEKEKSKCLKR